MKKITCVALATLMSSTAFAADAPAPLAFPAVSGPLKPNGKPIAIDGGPVGKINVGGVVSGIGFQQSNEVAADQQSVLDVSNAQVFIQKNTGLVQFYAQAGAYSIPALGTAYIKAKDTTADFYDALPVAYVTLAPSDRFSFSAGKLPTLIGAEYTFTFQNANIQRGLLWNQENAVNRGVQANYTGNGLAASISLNDGFYSDDYNWLSGLVTYTINANNTIAFAAGGNLDKSRRSTVETPLLQNNSEIYNLMYTYKNDKWTIAPYLQYSNISSEPSIGIADSASTYGAALLATYTVNDRINIAGRAEYIESEGGSSVLYGADSDAWSFTVTPTYQQGAFFARAEASYVGVEKGTAGSQFGNAGNDNSQARLLVETGFLF